MWEAFNGRARVYAAAIDSGEEGALAEALGRNVWRTEEPTEGAPRLAEAVRRQRGHLAGQDFAALVAGEAHFLAADAALAQS